MARYIDVVLGCSTEMPRDLSDKYALELACERIRNTLGVTIDPAVCDAYLRGNDRTLVSYEKLEKSATPITAIQKYLLAAEAYRRQPSLEYYYDIFRCARIVPLLFAFDHALQVVLERVKHAAPRLRRLCSEVKTDSFDAALFEIVTASRYAEHSRVAEVSFVEETNQQQPDLCVLSDSGPIYVECKRFDRSSEAAIKLRLAARRKAEVVLEGLRQVGITALFEITFKVNPADIPDEEMARCAHVALRTGAPVVTEHMEIDHRRLACGRLDDYALFPSPAYFAQRYGFITDGEWQGIVPQMYAKYIGPSWLDAVDWEAAVKWKVTDKKVLWQMKRLGYSLLFKGMAQLASPHDAEETVLHVCFERETSLGPRRDELMHFVETLRKRDEHTFGWTVFNELVINASPNGHFDFVEHAHIIAGPKRSVVRPTQPLVSTVFVPASAIRSGPGEFGVGVELPPIDEEVAMRESEPAE